MNPILRNILAVVAGVFVGSFLNMTLATSIGPMVFPLPEGLDPNDMESFKANAHLMTTENFIFPFLGHALGTLIGAFIAAKLAASHHMKLAIGIGFWFLLGGIVAVMLIPAPLWFDIFDLVVAYLPMGWLGWKLAGSKNEIS